MLVFINNLSYNLCVVLLLKLFSRFIDDFTYTGIPAVITVSPQMTNDLADGVPIGEACKRLEDAGAAVVGLNCFRGPTTILEPLKLVKQACKVSTVISD